MIGRATGKQVILCPENAPEEPFVTYTPSSDRFTHWSGGLRGVGGEPVEQLGEPFRVLHHREVTAGDLDRLDAEQFARDESFPVGREELVIRRVDERSREIGMLGERIVPDR